jgi:acetyl esterase
MDLRSRVERALASVFLNAPPGFLRRVAGRPMRSPEGYELDRQGQALLWLMRVSHYPEMHERGVEGGRRLLDRRGPLLAHDNVTDVTTEDRTVPGAVGPRRARVYRPAGAASRSGGAPGLVYFHGGGFVLGSIESHDGVCRALASRAGIVIVSVDYRLAPEHQFPAGVDDAVASTRWILENASALGIDAAKVAVGGDSAGGNLATVAAIGLRGAPRTPAFQLLAYPATDLTREMPSHRFFRARVMLPEETIVWFRENYLPDLRLERDPRASPLFTADLSGLPPALVVTAGFDPLRDEGKAYADRMREAGVPVEYVCSESSMHAFLNIAGVVHESARMLDLVVDRLRAALAGGRAATAA